MKKKKEKHISGGVVVMFAMTITLVLFLLALVIGQSMQVVRLEKQLLEYQEPSGLVYRYNFTRCVFEYGNKTAVCNLVMRDSCSEIKELDENCEVLE